MLSDEVIAFLQNEPDADIHRLRAFLSSYSPFTAQPVDHVHWVPVDQVVANGYNPNSVARTELALLYLSIKHDGYTQPVVTVKDNSRGELYLPCGDIISVSEIERSLLIWNILQDLQKESLVIPLESLTVKEQSLHSKDMSDRIGEVAFAFKSLKLLPTMDKTCASGCEISGEWEKFIRKLDYAQFSSGMCLELPKFNTYWELVCPICALKDPKRLQHWSSYKGRLEMSIHEECGLLVNCLSCEKTTQEELSNLQENLSEVKMQSVLSDAICNFPLLRVKHKPTYIIVDGFHRYFVLKSNPDLLAWTNGMLPIVVLDKPLSDRMASTVRHNRARGKHSVAGMSNMVFSLLEQGWDDAAICNELGMEAEELLRLKHITGFSKLFANTKYKQAWESKRQVLLRKEYGSTHTNGNGEAA